MATSTSGVPVGFDIRTDLRGLLADLKKIDPKLATAIRRKMRQAGDSAIAEMTQVLEAYRGGVTGTTVTAGKDSAGHARRYLVQSAARKAAARSRSTGARRAVEQGLKFRVTAGKTRTTVRLTSTGGALRKALNRQVSWRHPVFSDRGTWVAQPGDNYFNAGVHDTLAQIRKGLQDAIVEGLQAIDQHRYGE